MFSVLTLHELKWCKNVFKYNVFLPTFVHNNHLGNCDTYDTSKEHQPNVFNSKLFARPPQSEVIGNVVTDLFNLQINLQILTYGVIHF